MSSSYPSILPHVGYLETFDNIVAWTFFLSAAPPTWRQFSPAASFFCPIDDTFFSSKYLVRLCTPSIRKTIAVISSCYLNASLRPHVFSTFNFFLYLSRPLRRIAHRGTCIFRILDHYRGCAHTLMWAASSCRCTSPLIPHISRNAQLDLDLHFSTAYFLNSCCSKRIGHPPRSDLRLPFLILTRKRF
ncbi:hypothetical protein BDZ89DRAFT_176398 [Hymenopellis radicata]|nr:hypothetical protein BDZ89DRAFT_176398 [Hymenopellis radicata]